MPPRHMNPGQYDNSMKSHHQPDESERTALMTALSCGAGGHRQSRESAHERRDTQVGPMVGPSLSVSTVRIPSQILVGGPTRIRPLPAGWLVGGCGSAHRPVTPLQVRVTS